MCCRCDGAGSKGVLKAISFLKKSPHYQYPKYFSIDGYRGHTLAIVYLNIDPDEPEFICADNLYDTDMFLIHHLIYGFTEDRHMLFTSSLRKAYTYHTNFREVFWTLSNPYCVKVPEEIDEITLGKEYCCWSRKTIPPVATIDCKGLREKGIKWQPLTSDIRYPLLTFGTYYKPFYLEISPHDYRERYPKLKFVVGFSKKLMDYYAWSHNFSVELANGRIIDFHNYWKCVGSGLYSRDTLFGLAYNTLGRLNRLEEIPPYIYVQKSIPEHTHFKGPLWLKKESDENPESLFGKMFMKSLDVLCAKRRPARRE